MKTISIRRRLLASTIVAGAMLGSLPALAQVANDPAQASAGPLEGQAPVANADGDNKAAQGGDIVVTGSRIRSPNLEATSPVTVVNSEEFKLTGTTRTEDLINSLPQAFAGQSGNISNGSSGIATINLRGLGPERNLVLVNGRRVVPGDPSSAAVDINVIPAAIIKRVDVLTGGASSVYGADAVTGVVNFVMDTDFEGFRLDGQYSLFNHNNRGGGGIRSALDSNSPYGAPAGYPKGMSADGGTIDVTAAFGTSFDDGRGHITAYGGYRKINAVIQANRDYSSCSLSANTASVAQSTGRPYACAGSATSPQGSFIAFDGTGSDFTSTFFQPGAGGTFAQGRTPFNFNPLNYYQRPDERYTAGFFANYEVSDSIKPYAEFMFMDDRTVAQIAPSGNFGNTTSINCDNPLLSAAQRSVICARNNLLVANNQFGQRVVGQGVFDQSTPKIFPDTNPAVFFDPTTGAAYNRGYAQILRRNVEGGPRQDDLQHTSFRGVIGSRGDLGKAWTYDAYYQYGRTNFAETYSNDFSITRLGRALDVVSNPNGGAPVCRSVLTGQDPNCVPYNVFSLNSVSPQAVAYLSTPGFQRGVVSEQVASASFSGQLGEYGIKSPWAAEGLGIALGTEYRKEALDFKSDLAFQTGDLAGQGAATLPVRGSFDVKEVFGELRVPVVFDSFIYNLSFTGGYRYSSYKTSAGRTFSTDTYKIEGEFAPIRDIRFRGGYNRAVRAPTVQDLFSPSRVALSGNGDPCADKVLTAADRGCLAQGLRIGQRVASNPSAQYNGLLGGNPNLLPEVADTYTAGVVLQPSFLPRFALTVDFFDIKVKNAVTSIGVDTILNACNTTLNAEYCGLINRDSAGSLWLTPQGYVVNTTKNIGGLATRGIDVGASYSYPLGDLGSLGFNFNGTWLDRLVTDTGVTGSYDCVGLFGPTCLQPSPEWRHNARISFNSPSGVGMSLRWRYFGNVKIDATDKNSNLNNTGSTGPAPGGVARPGLAELGVQSYFDLAMTFRVSDAYTFRLGANNLLDREPPLTGSQACPGVVCNGNTFPGVYDALGRYIYAGVTLDL
ncbi:TonB-dependent receptor domain-containing protein [uncultured Sphingomonas sp.]|uniref:TonB-dependent receptor domain-containing protein n=1 Tax=uncultured Sphingomonas sp. TaxID=158754 RepID=UPI00374920FF